MDITFKRHRAQLASSLLAAFKVDDDWADAHPDEVPNLDGDPLTSSQEMSNGYSVGAATRDGSDEVVPSKYDSGPKREQCGPPDARARYLVHREHLL